MGAPLVTSLEQLIQAMDAQGFDWKPDERMFMPRPNRTERGMPVPLTVREALRWIEPSHYLDRSNEQRGDRPLPPVQWPDWAW
ncbi:hypothetical protein [Miltoncostaea marina]|uniref:hypothetical protein n=1 Tax=Miltoncostaea marina TaxID=2843215 RepID=UPI001C3D0E77|nr:hypothetical protein [Miltoncostaea marina]